MIHRNRAESVSVLSACLRETMGFTAHDVNHALVERHVGDRLCTVAREANQLIIMLFECR